MQAERNLIKKLLFIVKGLDAKEVKLTDIQLIYNDDGTIIGYKIEIKKEVVKLRLIPTGSGKDD